MQSDDIVFLHNGPGSLIEPAVLVTRVSKPHPKDPLNIQVWTVKYFSDPDLIQTRAVTPSEQIERRKTMHVIR